MVSISLIVPIYNVEQFVQRCLESIMTQNLDGVDLECLIIDDDTQDLSMNVVHQLVLNYHGQIHFELIRHKVNMGLSAARNTGLFHAKGDYVFFVDSDDYLAPDTFQYFLDNLRLYPSIDMVIGNVKACKTGEKLIRNICDPWYIDDPNIFFTRLLHHQIYLYAWNKLIKRELLIKNNIFFENGILYEDQCWSYQLFSKVSSVLLLPHVTYIYEYNKDSIVNTSQTIEKADKVIWSYTVSINKMLDNPPALYKYKRNLTVDYLLFMVNFLMNGVDVLSKFTISKETAKDFVSVRLRLLYRSLSYGRILLFFYFFILFPPLSHLQKFRFFRHHYYDLESAVNSICHLTDFLHRKN